MGLVQILVIWGLATVSPFSFSQEEVTKGNQRAPHQPPSWFARMAGPELMFTPEIDGFVVPDAIERHTPRSRRSNIRFACNPKMNTEGVVVWQFCEM